MADLSGLSTNFFATPKEGFTTTSAGSVASGAATVPLNSVTGYTNGAIATLVIEPTSGTAKQAFTGVVDTGGVQLTSVKWTEGTNQTHNAGSTVVDYTTATHFAALVKGLVIDHSQGGNHLTLHDTNGATWLGQTATASAVNYVRNTNAATTLPPKLAADGTDSNIDLQIAGKGTGKAHVDGFMEIAFDFVVSGAVWTADNVGVNLNASMTAGVFYINGQRGSIAAVTARAFTANVDTYIDVLNTAGVFSLVYTTAATNAASPALAANSIRIGIIQAAATITATTKVNQGQEDKVFPIASSIPYAVTDSLGNLIYPRDPSHKVLGYRQIITTFTTNATVSTQVTGLSVPVIVPAGRKIKITSFAPNCTTTSGAADVLSIGTWDGTVGSGTDLIDGHVTTLSTGYTNFDMTTVVMTTPAAGLHTYNLGFLGSASANHSINGASVRPIYILVELI